ncbi:ATP-binding cassette sub-family A member 1-like [Hyposmocoma kahamanoa]|uniref:ATP-binding cassette sub-family A member 1-like n=1 Tax=Hyposmocoma kahamanoa TaxID=1477025 RepID=UPI000E6D80E1|nr:ATP-binding cassette sub-family A member 1-like [Hyposmocoma kahamanoa]
MNNYANLTHTSSSSGSDSVNQKSKMALESLKTLKVLMYKHLVVRMKRFIHTPVELLSSMMYFLILFLVKDLIVSVTPEHLQMSDIKETEPYTLKVADLVYTNLNLILYTPDTNITRQLMDRVGPKLRLFRSNNISGDSRFMNDYIGVENETLLDYFVTTRKKSKNKINDMHLDQYSIVIFHDVEETKLPSHLRYTIKMNENFRVYDYQSEDSMIGPHYNFGEEYNVFMCIQWAIDSSYLELQGVAGIDKLQLTMQEFPFVDSVTQPNMLLVTTLAHLICYISLSLPFIFLMARLLEERSSGMQELIKMVGVSTNMLNISHFLNVLPTGLVYSICGTVFVTVGKVSLIPNTNPLLIFIMLLLYFISVMTFAFACSYIAKSAQYAVTLSTICFIMSWVPLRLLMAVKRVNIATLILTGMMPHVPMFWFWSEVSNVEKYGQGLQFADIFRPHSLFSGSVFNCYIMFILQIVVLAFVAWYLSKVRPGKFGTALPLTFLFEPSYWHLKKVKPYTERDEDDYVPMAESRDPRYFEKPPTTAVIGISINNLTKVYNKEKVLNNVSFDVYKGEITVLLGHNGAGKTTLMSIITGVTSATEGTVSVNGLDSLQNQQLVRKQLGLCPQENVFFPDLNVIQHIIFFSMLKGSSYKAAKASSHELMRRLKIADKAKNKSEELSGGMKRRLQLACALAGGGNVLILDEPTSGLDVETRRELWNLLLSLRGERTVLLTTHFMEEADALGDRVAALHAGRLRAVATPIYLKKNMGTGYRLSITTTEQRDKEAADAATRQITNFVIKRVPNSELKGQGLNSLEYSLPSASSKNFPKLFSELEEQRQTLGIESIGVGVSTLEEVFLKLCSDVDTNFTGDVVDGQLPQSPTYPKVKGVYMVLNQLPVLMLRHIKYLYFKKWSFIFMQVLLPILLVFVFSYSTNDSISASKNTANGMAMDLSIYKDMYQPKVLYKLDQNDPAQLKNFRRFNKVVFEETSNITDAIIRKGQQDLIEYSKYIAGIDLEGDNAKVYYTTTVRHAAPVAVNLLSNLLAAKNDRSITTYNQPLKTAFVVDQMVPKSAFTTAMWSLFVLFVNLSTVMNAVSLLIKERVSGTRHIHIMAGCPPLIHWMATFITHVLMYTAISVVPTLIAAAIMDRDNTINKADFLLFAFVVFELAVMAFLAFTYFVSFGFGERAALGMLTVVLMIAGLLPATVTIINDSGPKSEMGVWLIMISISKVFIPPHAALLALYNGGKSAEINAQCDTVVHLCKTQMIARSELKNCCDQNSPGCYFCFGTDRPGEQMLILLAQAVMYMMLVIFAQHGYLNLLRDKVTNLKYSKPQKHYTDEKVIKEATYVNKSIAQPVAQIPDAMLVDDVHKNYASFRCFRLRSCNAVKGVSFSVRKGECFGLLGVNGAGKSSTFRIITGEHCATQGQVFANGHFLRRPRQQYLQSLGYCPQFFGLDEFMTGRDNLVLLLKLRGLSGDDMDKEVKSWIEVVGLGRYANVYVANYSGGCKRRLAAAAALAQGAPVTLLDEPTAGVDVSARRRVWSALRRGQAQGRAVIITSHSLDEMEALCNRIAIMSYGELGALGSPAALRADHAAGHAVRLKLRVPDDGTCKSFLSSKLHTSKVS